VNTPVDGLLALVAGDPSVEALAGVLAELAELVDEVDHLYHLREDQHLQDVWERRGGVNIDYNMARIHWWHVCN
jgi:hypothetical protein